MKPWGVYQFQLRRLFGGEFFVSFVNIISYQGMGEGWKEGMESCTVTRRSLPYHIPDGSYHGQPHYLMHSDKLENSYYRSAIRPEGHFAGDWGDGIAGWDFDLL